MNGEILSNPRARPRPLLPMLPCSSPGLRVCHRQREIALECTLLFVLAERSVALVVKSVRSEASVKNECGLDVKMLRRTGARNKHASV